MSLSIINEASPNALTEIEQPHPHANTYIAPACGGGHTSMTKAFQVASMPSVKNLAIFR